MVHYMILITILSSLLSKFTNILVKDILISEYFGGLSRFLYEKLKNSLTE